MIGIVIVTHSQLGDALIGAAEFIIGNRPEAMESVSIDLSQNADKLRTKIAQGIKKVEGKEGILILTDMFGGTPSNLSFSFLKDNQIEIITGVNLPMLIKFASLQRSNNLKEVAKKVVEQGKKNIHLASALLNSRN